MLCQFAEHAFDSYRLIMGENVVNSNGILFCGMQREDDGGEAPSK